MLPFFPYHEYGRCLPNMGAYLGVPSVQLWTSPPPILAQYNRSQAMSVQSALNTSDNCIRSRNAAYNTLVCGIIAEAVFTL